MTSDKIRYHQDRGNHHDKMMKQCQKEWHKVTRAGKNGDAIETKIDLHRNAAQAHYRAAENLIHNRGEKGMSEWADNQSKKINEDVPTNSTGPNIAGTNNDVTWRKIRAKIKKLKEDSNMEIQEGNYKVTYTRDGKQQHLIRAAKSKPHAAQKVAKELNLDHSSIHSVEKHVSPPWNHDKPQIIKRDAKGNITYRRYNEEVELKFRDIYEACKKSKMKKAAEKK